MKRDIKIDFAIYSATIIRMFYLSFSLLLLEKRDVIITSKG